MSNLLGRSQFFEETANLFTDEKTANARSRVIEWLNESAMADASTKCNLLIKIQETIIESCVELLDEFLENVLSMGHDNNSDVRKTVVGFIEQMCKEKIEFLPRVTNILCNLLRDSAPQVVKRVIQACGSIYKNGIQWICTTTEITDSTEMAWNTLSLIKASILDMIDHDNDGIRTNSIKFLEGVVILQTYADEDSQKRQNDFSLEDVPLTLKIVRRRKLEEEAKNVFDVLLQFHSTLHISAVNLIACTGSLCTIAKSRPALMGPVVEAIKALNSNLPPTLTDSQVNSVRKSLKVQLINMLKNRGSFEFQAIIRTLLIDLGASQSEIMKAIPKMDKQEQQRRQKRILENAAVNQAKRPRIEKDAEEISDLSDRQMEIDYAELDEQKSKSSKLNEKFLTEALTNTENIVQIIIACLKHLPNEAPLHFFSNYTPIRDSSINHHISKIANLLGEQMSEKRIGPGAIAFTKDPPMRLCSPSENDTKNAECQKAEIELEIDEELDELKEMEEQQRKEEATKKLRENMEREKGEQALIKRMKQRAKTLKLQEVTKPLSRTMKADFLLDTVKRIVNSERQAIFGGVAAKRRKILTIMAATFPDNVRFYIFDFIMKDVKTRIDLAFSWLYEEYCLLQGFTRHSYVKSENSPDYAYNHLLKQIIEAISSNCEFKDKITLIRRVYMEVPLLPEESVKMLTDLCKNEAAASNYYLHLIKDLTILRPPRKIRFLRILLTFCIHDQIELREKAIQCVVSIYSENKLLISNCEEFALKWLGYLEDECPSAEMFSGDYGRPIAETAWREPLAKLCLALFLELMPYQEEFLQNLCNVYIATTVDLKRTILRTIESAIKKMGPENKTILTFIENCPKGVETLITRIIYILSERSTLCPDFVQKVRELYQNKVKDVRLLIPVLSGLSKQEILFALPKFLKLKPVVVKEIFNRLLGIGNEYVSQVMPISPSEILIALHTIDLSKCELKHVVKATSLCLAEKDVYTQEILSGCLQQLVEVTPLPTLLMRTVIQSLTLYPRLSALIINLLQRLITKQVWKQKVIWEGFLKCCQRIKPQSLSVLIQLPPQQLQDALTQCPEMRAPLLEYAETVVDSEPGHIIQQKMDILTGNAVDVFITDETGGYITLNSIKKEVVDDPEEEPVPIVTTKNIETTNQPLPPGEE